MAGSNGGQQYRTSIDLVRQIQQLSSIWSIEIARVKAAAASSSPAGLSAETAMLYGYLAERVGDNVAAAAERVAARMDYLRQTHQKIHAALQRSEVMVELPDGTDLDEEIEAGSAIANHVRREVNGIADLARRLASFSGLPNGDMDRDMVDVNACIDEVVAATEADRAASVSKRLGDVPEIFASKTEIRLLLAQILENSVRAAARARSAAVRASSPPSRIGKIASTASPTNRRTSPPPAMTAPAVHSK